MAAGGLSYSQARAITRVASAEDEQTWLDLATQTTAAQLEKAARGVTRALKEEGDPEEIAFRNRATQRWDDAGNLTLTFHIAAVNAPAAVASLEQAQAAEQADREAQLAQVAAQLAGADVSAETRDSGASDVPGVSAKPLPEEYYYLEPEYPGMAYLGLLPSEKPADLDDRIRAWQREKDRRRAKAQAWQEHQQHVLEAAAQQGAITRRATLTDGLLRLLTGARGDRVLVKLIIDPMSGWARTAKDELLPPAVATEILTHAGQALPRIRPITAADLLRHDCGRTSRVVTPALRSLLGLLDGEGCRFPGCTRTRKLQAHHVTYWRDGGSTDLANLALVCSRHHTLIHEQGFQLELQPDRTLIVKAEDGTRLRHLSKAPWQPKEDLDQKRRITVDSLPTQWNGDRLDLHHVAWVLAQHAA